MSDLLSIGASGVRAYQTALTTVSENIANAGNAAFTRRTTALTETLALGGATTVAGRNGMGVALGATSRSVDLYRNAQVRTASADLARTETTGAWLDRIQSALTGNQLGTRLTAFFGAARGVAADPSSTAPRAAMLESAVAAAGAFAATGAALEQVATDLDATADEAVGRLGSLGAALAKVNGAIGRTAQGSAALAGLADQRDAILEEMSALVDVSATFDAAGRAEVRIGGAGGPTLVSGTSAGTVSYVRNDAGAVSFAVLRDGEASSLTPGGGALGGVIDGARAVQDARAELDSVASAFASGVNDIQAEGRDLSGQPGAALFAIGDRPTAITVTLSDPAGIAAAAAGEGTRGNGNLARLEALRSSAGYEARTTALASANASAIAGRAAIAEAQTAIRDGAVAARDAISGVDLDREAVDLLRFQQAYQASSRVIQVARETFQSIIGING